MDSEERRIYPTEHPIAPEPLSSEKLTDILTKELVDWRLIKSPLPENITKIREELYREYSFESFNHAVDFLVELKAVCEVIPHHPRIENIWRTLRVYLTTWDIDYKVSFKDILLARNLDRLYTGFGTAEEALAGGGASIREDFLYHLRTLIAEDDMETLFWQLNEHYSVNSTTPTPNEFLLLASRFNAYQKKRRLGMETDEALRVEINKIKGAMLEVLDLDFLG